MLLSIQTMADFRTLQVKKHIESMDDVREFFRDLHRWGLHVHPDDSFADYVRESDNISVGMIQRLDETLERVWDVCEANGVDPSEIAWDEYSMDEFCEKAYAAS